MEFDLIGILLLIFFGRSLGVLTQRLGFQSLVGEVLGGILVGAMVVTGLIVIHMETVAAFGDLGIILIMLLSGLITDFRSFNQNKRSSIVVGGLGVLASFAIVFFPVMWLTTRGIGLDDTTATATALFVAVIISNTAIEVTANLFTRKSSHGSLHSIVMGAAFVDDIIAVFLLGIVSSVALKGELPSMVELAWLSITVMIFLLISLVVVTSLVGKVFDRLMGRNERDERILLTATILLGFTFALLARQFGLHEVIGAYIAGLIIGKWGSQIGPLLKKRLAWGNLVKGIEPPLRAIFGPLFFGYIGLMFATIIFDVGISITILLMALFLFFLAIMGKLVGCGLGSLVTGHGTREAFLVGTAMCGRGALELVLLRYGLEIGIIDQGMFTALVIVTLLTIMLTPVMFAGVNAWYRRSSPTGEFA